MDQTLKVTMADTKRFFRALGMFSVYMISVPVFFGLIFAIVWGLSKLPERIKGPLLVLGIILGIIIVLTMIALGIKDIWQDCWENAYYYKRN